MRKILMASVLTLALTAGFNAYAQGGYQNTPAGGYKGPTINAVKVSDVKNFSDDTPVVLVGKIEKSLGAEKYNFVDETGSIIVEIDDDDWNGLSVTENDTVEIHGEVDKSFTKLEIEVDRVIKK